MTRALHASPEHRRAIVDELRGRPFEEIVAFCEKRLADYSAGIVLDRAAR